MVFDSAGNLYVSSYYGNAIEKFNSSGKDLGVFASWGVNSRPEGMAFDRQGNLYVACQGNNTIEKFNSSGTDLGVFGSVRATSLAFDSAGNLYAVNFWNNTVEEFNSSGTDLGVFASSGLDGPQGLAFQPVPEPATWALLAVGLIAVVPLRRRRDKVCDC